MHGSLVSSIFPKICKLVWLGYYFITFIDLGQTVYALLGTDANGFAYITGIDAKKTEAGDYVEARASYTVSGYVSVILPFKRFYMREDLVPQAEKAYQSSAGKDGSVSVRIKNGMGVIEQLYIGDKTIYDYFQSKRDR